MKLKYTALDIQNRLKEVHGDLVALIPETYCGMKKKATFIDKEFGEWNSIPYDVLRGYRNPKHGYNLSAINLKGKKRQYIKVRNTAKDVNRKIYEIHGDTVSMDDGTYSSMNGKATFIDKEFGSWESTPTMVISGHCHKKRGLIKRSKNMTRTIEEVIKLLPNFVKIIPETYINSNTKCKFIDEKYGEFWRQPTVVINNQIGHQKRQILKRRINKFLPIEKIISELPNNIKIDATTYIGSAKKARFIDEKYGEFWNYPHAVIYRKIGHHKATIRNSGVEKSRATCLRKYGVEYPTQRKETIEKRRKNNLIKYGVVNPTQLLSIGLRIAKSSNNSCIKFHWKTNEELVCVGSYEAKSVDYLNNNKIEFLWQPKVFKMPNNKTYRPDLYLVSEDKWVEIKGYFRKDAQDKWDWFCKENPNSELWNKEKLKQMGIL